MSDAPLFIDPVPEDAGDVVGEARVPRWFVLFAVAVLGVAVYYLLAFMSGPRLTSPHNFVPGRAAWLEQSPTPPATAGSPAPEPSPSESASPTASPSPSS